MSVPEIAPQNVYGQAVNGGAAPAGPVVKIDQVEFMEMAAALGPEGMHASVKAFVRDLNETAGRMKLQVMAGDGPAVRRLAHRMKGLLAQFGATELARVAERLEAGEPEATAGDAAQLLDCVPAAVEAVQRAARMTVVQS